MAKRVTISALQDNPIKYFHECHKEPVEVMRHGQTVGFIVSPSAVNTTNALVGSLNTNLSSTIKEEHEEKNHK